MSDRSRSGRLIATLVGVLLLSSCGEAGDPLPLEPAEPTFASSGPVLVECPTETSESASGMLGPLGGVIQLDKHALELPLHAVTAPTEFRLATPVSNYMELTVGANGAESFEFQRASAITIDYSRCTRSNIDKAPLTVWQVHPETKELLEHMGGVDDKDARTVTFQTDHLSTFAIAH